MAESNRDKSAEMASSRPASSPASSPDELIKDLDIKLSEAEESSVVGGAKVDLEYKPQKPY